MASNILSRLLPSADDDRSVYERLQQRDQPPLRRRRASPGSGGEQRYHDHRSDSSASPFHDDDDEHRGDPLDEENLAARFQDQDLDHLLADAAQSHITTESTAFLPHSDSPGRQRRDMSPSLLRGSRGPGAPRDAQQQRPRWMRGRAAPAIPHPDDEDEDVPASLMLEGDTAQRHGGPSNRRVPGRIVDDLPPPVPGPATQNTRAQWDATRAQQQLHNDEQVGGPSRLGQGGGARGGDRRRGNSYMMADPKERAKWKWANVQDLDRFLHEVYEYFAGHGIWSITLRRLLNLLKSAFVIGFSTFLTKCIDYKEIPKSQRMEEILVPQCIKRMSSFWNITLWIFVFFWIYKVFQYTNDLPRLWGMHNFYHYLLDIPDRDIQSVSWQDVVEKLMILRDTNPVTAQNVSAENRRFLGTQSKQRMDAHDIANRLMRQENYMIALFNKDILDLRVPYLGNRQFFSQTMEWHLKLCIMDFVFDEHGHVRPNIVDSHQRRHMIESLRRRISQTAVLSILCAPFAVVYYSLWGFFEYFTEYHREPSRLGLRSFTPLAEWKFRDFNELYHLFERRRNMAYPYASRYLDQFPKDKMNQTYRFVAFITGALAAVLGLATLFDPELFLGFEITPNRTAIFYLGILTAIFQAARSAVPDEQLVLDPEFALNNVIDLTHYCPASWQGRLRSDEVRREFAALYQLKVVIFFEELLSMVLTPIVIAFTLPNCAERIIDFFREFTVHVDGLGHVCSFAVFNFKRGPENNTAAARPAPSGPGGAGGGSGNGGAGGATGGQPATGGLRDDYFAANDNKMMASYLSFLDNYSGQPGGGGRAGHLPPMYGRHYLNHQRRTFFNPPPPFPGLGPGTAAAAAAAGASPPMQQHHAQGQPPTALAGSSTPRFGPHATGPATAASPLHSTLLDPHHQPSPPLGAGGARTSPRQGPAGARFRGARPGALDEVAEAPADQVEAGGVQQQQPGGAATTSRMIEEDSSLGDSWRVTRAGQMEDEEDGEAEGEGGEASRGAPGVLGLLKQFQRVHTEGKGVVGV
ncbi:autophagy protein Apg9-domain-containing protein [Lineolata rhizophorae]|uniref:Autophagy-related protein 9 n=1 Tax=Lineolata rhizophorae TaxID=578093 RepID=A0A6A6P1F7_9PEZI|nr:autophagy protein Apg9-domain-containing protein [Lineolata rhizophorae]